MIRSISTFQLACGSSVTVSPSSRKKPFSWAMASGAMSVSLLMTSPQGAGLFQRAIGQSGGVFEPLQLAPSYLLANAEKDGVDYATSVGASSLAELRALPADRLLGGRAWRYGSGREAQGTAR